MQRTEPDDFTDELMKREPDIPALKSRMRGELNLQEAEARQVLYQSVRAINRKLFHPLSQLELILTERCNLACRYCFEKNCLETPRGRSRIMPDSVIRAAIDLLFDYSRNAPDIDITLFGGEPLLNFSGIETATLHAEELCRAHGRNLHLNMTTNGLLLDETKLGFLSRHGIRVLLSIDGLAPSHDRYRVDRKGNGTFSRALAALRQLKRHQPWIGVKMTVMPSEAERLYENVRGLYGHGANQFVIGHVSDAEWTEERIAAFVDQYARLRSWYLERRSGNDIRIEEFESLPEDRPVYGCRAARTCIAVDTDGTITGCSRISTLESGHPPVGLLGDVVHGLYGLSARLEMSSCRTLRANIDDAGISGEYRTGCFATNYEANKDVYKPNLAEHVRKRMFDAVRIGKA